MSLLTLTIVDAAAASATAAPAINLRLRIEDDSGRRVHALALRCLTRIDARRRRYTKEEAARLYELFGHVSQWDRTLQALTWAHSSLLVPSFDGRIDVDLPLACTYDLEVASAKYLHAIRSGDVPLSIVFSGTMFRCLDGRFETEPVPWDLETTHLLAADVWRAAMDRFFPGGGWVRLQRDTIDRLQAFRGRHALVSWDAVMDRLLEQEAARV